MISALQIASRRICVGCSVEIGTVHEPDCANADTHCDCLSGTGYPHYRGSVFGVSPCPAFNNERVRS